MVAVLLLAAVGAPSVVWVAAAAAAEVAAGASAPSAMTTSSSFETSFSSGFFLGPSGPCNSPLFCEAAPEKTHPCFDRGASFFCAFRCKTAKESLQYLKVLFGHKILGLPLCVC